MMKMMMETRELIIYQKNKKSRELMLFFLINFFNKKS